MIEMVDIKKLSDLIAAMTPEEVVKLFEEHQVSEDVTKQYAFLELFVLAEKEKPKCCACCKQRDLKLPHIHEPEYDVPQLPAPASVREINGFMISSLGITPIDTQKL